MKKQKNIDHYVMMACLSNTKTVQKQSIDELLAAVLTSEVAAAAEPLSTIIDLWEMAAV